VHGMTAMGSAGAGPFITGRQSLTRTRVARRSAMGGAGPGSRAHAVLRLITMTEMRVDKWLWAARFFKSRTLAAAACDGGKVDVNDQGVKPSRMVRPGDRLTIGLSRIKRIVRVVALSEQRGPGAEAAKLYDDLTPPPPPRELRPAQAAYRPPGAGRPTKRERRQIDRLSY
jgi:ribosome-associated heat shock protein Hsp15